MTPGRFSRSVGYVLAREVFKAELRSLPAIRAFVEKWAAEVGLDDDQTYRIKLAVSEASAYDIEHPAESGDITLWVRSREGRFTVDIWHDADFVLAPWDEGAATEVGIPLMITSADELSFACLPEGGTHVSLSMVIKRGAKRRAIIH